MVVSLHFFLILHVSSSLNTGQNTEVSTVVRRSRSSLAPGTGGEGTAEAQRVGEMPPLPLLFPIFFVLKLPGNPLAASGSLQEPEA